MDCNSRSCNGEPTTLLPSITYFVLASNGISSIIRAYAGGNYSMLAFIVFVYLAFLLLQHCLSAYQRLPPHQESRTKALLKFAIWFLFSAIMFGFANQFAQFLGPAAGMSLYAIATAGSALLFFVDVMYDDREEEKRKSSHDQSACTGEEQVSDEKIHQFDSVLEKV